MTPPRNLTMGEPQWQPISTYPRGELVRLRSPKFPNVSALFERKGDQWETVLFAPMGKQRACWGQDEEQPTEWLNASPTPPHGK